VADILYVLGIIGYCICVGQFHMRWDEFYMIWDEFHMRWDEFYMI